MVSLFYAIYIGFYKGNNEFCAVMSRMQKKSLQCEDFIKQLPVLSQHFTDIVLLHSTHYTENYQLILGLGAKEKVYLKDHHSDIHLFFDYIQKDFWIGFLSYDIKNNFEKLQSTHPNRHQTPLAGFIRPEILIKIDNQGNIIWECNAQQQQKIEELLDINFSATQDTQTPTTQQNISKEEYIENVHHIQNHIRRGDIFEMNYCMEFFAENCEINPENLFQQLTQLSPNPFCAFVKMDDWYVVSASPERFLSKIKNKILAQPIKGTSARNEDVTMDEKNKNELRNNPKEQSENVMIVDLVRNDLSKIAKKGSVKVKELFGIYSFPTVHQMISSIECETTTNDLYTILKANFPMGSMTGAPKVRAMELAEQYETFSRGIYSGSIGFVDNAQKSFDFNVVIRSIIYNSKLKNLSFPVGSAITHYADAEKEYEECWLKAKAILQILK